MFFVPMMARTFRGYQGNDSFTKLLLHGNGADASTTFTDSAASPKTFTAFGNAQIDTAQSKFGGASMLFDGTGDYITTPDSADFAFGAGNFTIDFWIRRNTAGSRVGVLGQTNSGASSYGPWLEITAGNVFSFQDVSLATLNATTTVTNDSTWHHVAIVRDTTTGRMFIDGVAAGTASWSTTSANDTASVFGVGNVGDGSVGLNYFNGWVDELRVSKGIARWTSGFTPPTIPYN